MQQEVERKDASPEHVAKCREKLRILLEQRADLSMAISQLLDEIESGKKYMKVYKQMKMYNDPALNPVYIKVIHFYVLSQSTDYTFVGIGRCRDDYSRGLFRMPGLS